MRHHPYLERAAHVLAAVALAAGLLFAVPMLDALSRPPDAPLHASRAVPAARVEEGELVARISVPRLDLDAPVYEGVRNRTLAGGAGHVPGTPLPGEEDATNASVIAVARDAGPAALADLRVGERVQMRTRFGLKRYRVAQRRVLPPGRLPFGPAGSPRVTFMTAYPADSVGPAPLRLAVILVPAGDEEASSEAGSNRSPVRTAALRRPTRQPTFRRVLNQPSMAWRKSETRPTGLTEISAYSEASAALPEGR